MTTATEIANKVTITDAGPSAKKVAIEIPAEAVSAKLRDSIDSLAGEAQMPGFRKGRVPRALLEKRFGATLRKEAKNELVGQALNKAIEEHKLRVVGQPAADDLAKAELQSGKPFAFEIEVEVLPEFTLPSLDGISIKKPIFELTDEQVSEEVRKILINEGSLESRDASEPGDYLTGHAVMTDDKGHEYYNLKGAVVQKPAADREGKGMILGIMVDDFDSQMGSPKPGDSFTVKATGPENHEVEGIRGAKLNISFQVERVDRIIPAPIEQIVQSLGFDSEQRFRDAVRGRMDQRIQIQQQSVMHQQLAKHLIDSTEMALPERMSSQQAARTLEKRRLELLYRGIDMHKIEEHMAELRSATAAEAGRELKLFFILHRIAEDLRIRVDEVEVSQRIAQMAMQRNVRPEQLRAELIQTRQIGGIFQQIRDHKTLDALLYRAKVEEMPADDFNKAMREATGGEAKSEKPAKASKSKAAEPEADSDKGDEEKADAPKKSKKKK